ncbi:transglutaminase-like cysteine peptidase [Rhizobiaceae bacterium n13]|uniref:Transglutaminase-like cysteine peptidase n=1 Tax=Ferirhizobium litorale TaxID=2927786 RepID=A0AAE3U6H4_9HYPH|nr:transglutaminase-like cysteine peptidase [Fererhizobium litorale]MDI7864944.1 transglutaminase-like cysteine peptidase [Fererhizobium litorale]MDI7925064.1 transglutaminase-like cysteine peptidase [Fererhizobium litorale]
MIQATRSIHPPEGFVSACSRYDWLCTSRSGRSMGDAEAMGLLKRVNGAVNSSVRAVADGKSVGRREHWSLPINGRGDCEDFALAKMKQLIAAGFRADRLAMTVVLDRRGNNHAVLLARLDSGDFVLDNLSGTVKAWHRTGYTFLARQNFDNKRAWNVILAGPRAGRFFRES